MATTSATASSKKTRTEAGVSCHARKPVAGGKNADSGVGDNEGKPRMLQIRSAISTEVENKKQG